MTEHPRLDRGSGAAQAILLRGMSKWVHFPRTPTRCCAILLQLVIEHGAQVATAERIPRLWLVCPAATSRGGSALWPIPDLTMHTAAMLNSAYGSFVSELADNIELILLPDLPFKNCP